MSERLAAVASQHSSHTFIIVAYIIQSSPLYIEPSSGYGARDSVVTVIRFCGMLVNWQVQAIMMISSLCALRYDP